MKATYFYNRKLIGDVLLIVIDNDAQATHIETKDDICVIYNNDRVIGINVFNISEVVKFKNEGRIILPPDTVIDIINNRLTQFGIEKLDYVKETGFKVGRILTVEEHPESSHLHCLISKSSFMMAFFRPWIRMI